jgi:hypothetical protein
MPGKDISQPELGGGVNEWRSGTRLFLCCAATAAFGGSLWAAVGEGDCGECRQASSLLSGIPLAWVGAAFYGVLATAAGLGGLSRLIKAGFVAASGVHVVLLALLAWERIFCGACVATGIAALAGAVVSLAARPRAGRWAAAVFTAAALAALGGTLTARVFHAQNETRQTHKPQGGEQPAPIKAGHVRLVVYERIGCRHCIEFEERVLPRLEAAFGDALEVERRNPTLTMETPTIEIHGKGVRVFVGPTSYEDLDEAIQLMR